MTIFFLFPMYRREALYIWKQRNGSRATYNRLINIFEQAGYRSYADEVRRIVHNNDSEIDDSSSSEEEIEQPQMYPIQRTQALSQLPPPTSGIFFNP